MRGWLVLIVLLLLLARQATAACILGWDLERDVPVTVFRITITNLVAQTQDQLEVIPSAPGACGIEKAETYCAQLPGSPPPGVYGLFVQAIIDGETTDEETAQQNGLLCHIIANGPCQCKPIPEPTAAPMSQATSLPVPSMQPLSTIPQDVRTLLIAVPATPSGTALAGPELLQQALNVSALPVALPQTTT